MSDPLEANATAPPSADVAPDDGQSLGAGRTRPRRRPSFDARRLARHAGLPLVLALSAVIELHRLSQNGYANIFYSAGVKSMLRSWHNFFYVSFDPGGLVTVDKPPLALWVQVASAKLFGFSPLSLLVPEALAGVLTVARALPRARAAPRRRSPRSPARSRSPCSRRLSPSRATTASTPS